MLTSVLWTVLSNALMTILTISKNSCNFLFYFSWNSSSWIVWSECSLNCLLGSPDECGSQQSLHLTKCSYPKGAINHSHPCLKIYKMKREKKNAFKSIEFSKESFIFFFFLLQNFLFIGRIWRKDKKNSRIFILPFFFVLIFLQSTN